MNLDELDRYLRMYGHMRRLVARRRPRDSRDEAWRQAWELTEVRRTLERGMPILGPRET